MDYTILDSAGNALASFADDELAARATLHAMVAVEPDAAEDVVLLAYGDDGLPVGRALSFYDCPPPVTFAETPAPVLESLATASCVRVIRSQRRYVGPMVVGPRVTPVAN